MENNFLTFDPEVHQPDILKAWKNFIKTGKINDEILPKEIAESWKRSRDAGVDPYDFSKKSYLDDVEYRKQLSEGNKLIELSKPIMESIYNSLEKTRYLVVLYNDRGYHLLRIGKRKDFMRSQEFKIKEGLCFEESEVGTCGFSLVKSTKKPIQIIGCEHYSSLLHYVTGSYAPILTLEDKKLIGVIGVTGAKTLPNDHTLGIAIAAATAIQNLLKLDELRKEQYTLAESLHIAINAIEDPLVVLDSSLYVIEMNNKAKKLFNKKICYNCHIKDFDSIENIKNAIIQFIESKKETSKQLECRIRDKIYLAKLKLLRNSKTSISGVVIQFKSINEIAKIYQDIAGDKPWYSLKNIVAKNKKMIEIKNIIEIAAKSDANVIIEGESGVGKEVVAQCIHNESARKANPFVAINCAAIPQELLESTLFGHEKGSFTGADTTHLGKFELANHGTLLLDEIGEMSFNMQAKILRAIETQNIERVGGRKPISIDVRIIAATNKDLYDLIKRNLFRADLFYRLNVFRICLPPLRERREEIQELLEMFLDEFSRILKIDKPKYSEDYIATLSSYSWPGNIRELKNAVQYSIARLKRNERLDSIHLKGFFPDQNNLNKYCLNEMKNKNLDSIEKEIIDIAIKECGGNKANAARKLGISRATLYRKIKEK
jgi:transcriptional regulator with PAS, ATPase and Fis domain